MQPVSGVATLLETLNATPSNPQCLPSSPLTDTEVEGLRISILASSAYVCLCLGEPVMAVEHAKALLALPTLPGAYRLLGHLYAAEGLLQLDQISEAVELLQPDTLPADLGLTLPEPMGTEHEPGAETRPQAPWEPMSVMTARATMLYNLAVAYAIRGNLDKASETISLVWASKTESSKIPVHLIMLTIYVELQQGHVQNARNLLIKHGIPHQPGWGNA
ncbi:hypothetical protein B566_EDAN010666 [Ephemera danica]|nr:hypothetical protein B566_EDAN010666 [Ephemera danica]